LTLPCITQAARQSNSVHHAPCTQCRRVTFLPHSSLSRHAWMPANVRRVTNPRFGYLLRGLPFVANVLVTLSNSYLSNCQNRILGTKPKFEYAGANRTLVNFAPIRSVWSLNASLVFSSHHLSIYSIVSTTIARRRLVTIFGLQLISLSLTDSYPHILPPKDTANSKRYCKYKYSH
jgi:hypothetical protein